MAYRKYAIIMGFAMSIWTVHANADSLTAGELLSYCKEAQDTLSTYSMELARYGIDQGIDFLNASDAFRDAVNDFKTHLRSYSLFLSCHISCDTCSSCIEGMKNSLCEMQVSRMIMIEGLVIFGAQAGTEHQTQLIVLEWLVSGILNTIRNSSPYHLEGCIGDDMVTRQRSIGKN